MEKGKPGFSTEPITGKSAKRAVWQAEIKLEGARVPVENRLAHSNGFEDTVKVLTDTRYFVAWEAVGPAVAYYEPALTYAKKRRRSTSPW